MRLAIIYGGECRVANTSSHQHIHVKHTPDSDMTTVLLESVDVVTIGIAIEVLKQEYFKLLSTVPEDKHAEIFKVIEEATA